MSKMIKLVGEDNTPVVSVSEINTWLTKPCSEIPINLFREFTETRCKQLLKACIVQLLHTRLDKPNLFETAKKLRLFGIDDISYVFTQKEADWIITECDSRGYTHLGCELILRGLDPKFEVLSKCKHMALFYTCNVLTVDLPEQDDSEYKKMQAQVDTDFDSDFAMLNDRDLGHSGVPTISNTTAPSLQVKSPFTAPSVQLYTPEKSQNDLVSDPRTKLIEQDYE